MDHRLKSEVDGFKHSRGFQKEVEGKELWDVVIATTNTSFYTFQRKEKWKALTQCNPLPGPKNEPLKDILDFFSHFPLICCYGTETCALYWLFAKTHIFLYDFKKNFLWKLETNILRTKQVIPVSSEHKRIKRAKSLHFLGQNIF